MASSGSSSDISTGLNTGSSGNSDMSSLTNDNGSFVETGVSQMATRASFLSLFILAGFLGNCMLVATIAQSKRLRASMLNLHIISMASVNLVDTTLNMPLILGSTITQTWDYGGIICQFNSFFVQMVNIATLMCLCMMAMDRVIAVINPDKYKERLGHRNTVIIIIYTWVQSVVFSVPVLTGTVPSKAFGTRYLCSIAENAPLIYIGISSCFSILVPVFLTIIFFVIIIRSCIRQKVHDRDTLAQNTYTSRAGAEQKIWFELYAARYVGLLCIMWVIMAGPYVTLNYVEQYKNSAETQNLPAFIMFTYPWEVDLAFMWMKLSYVLILPMFTYVLRKEVWQKIKDLMLCRKSNTITDAAPGNTPPSQQDLEQARELRLNQVQQNSFSPPILFAIADGIHVVSHPDKRIEEIHSESEILSESTDAMILRARKCDVNASHEFLHGDEDTSDYDSQCDPFSVSNPISVKDLPQAEAKPAFEAPGRPQPKDSIARVKKESTDEGVGSQETNSENVTEDVPVNSAGMPANNNSGRGSWDETTQREKGDSGIESTQNTNEKDRKRHRRRRTRSGDGISQMTKVEKFENGGAGVENDESKDNALEPADSGRGTGEVKKTRRRKRTESSGPDHEAEAEALEKTVVENFVENTVPDTPESVPKSQLKKKKKRRGKNPADVKTLTALPPLPPDQSSIEDSDGCRQCQQNQAEDSVSPGKRPPPRLKPLDIVLKKDLKTSQSPPSSKTHVDTTDNPAPVSLSETNDMLFEKKLIPNIPRTERDPSPRRKSGDRSEDCSGKADSSVIPGQMELEDASSLRQKAPRKSSKSSAMNSLSASQVAQAESEAVPKVNKLANESHFHASSGDSQTALLGSNTSSDLQQMKKGMLAAGVLTEEFPRPKKRKKKRPTKTDSSQDLLTGSAGVAPNK